MTGHPGKALTVHQRQQVERLLDDGLEVQTIHVRTGFSRSMIRIIMRERRQRDSAEQLADELWPDDE